MKCRICSSKDLKLILSLGNTPLANSFLSEKDLYQEETKFPLEIYFCPNCKLVQLGVVVPPELMFKNYVYLSSTTDTFRKHFTKMAEDISNYYNLSENSLAVDIGSNDGLLLKGFQKMKVQTIGVEPATNVSRISEQNGVETINDFFNKNVVEEIINRKGHADVITATNVFAHIDNIHDVAENVRHLLKKDGIFVIEFPYLIDMLEKMTFDAIYHEHLSYFSLTPLVYFFKEHKMEIFDAQRVESHGGSLRVFVKKSEGKFQIKKSVTQMLEDEKKYGIGDFGMYRRFSDKVYLTKTKLVEHLKKIRSQGKIVAAYGAPAKGNTLLNFCNIGMEYIDYVVDDNPLKIGLYTPGTHIPVVSSRALDEKKPDYILILAWNFAQEILAKTKKYAEKGVKFIIPVPEPVEV